MEELSAPRAVVRVRVPFVDVDSSDRIHFTAMFRYMEVAEHALMRSLVCRTRPRFVGWRFRACTWSATSTRPSSSTTCSMSRARVDHVGTRSWTLAFAGRHVAPDAPADAEATGKPAAVGRMTIVAMDPATQRATPLPAHLRRALTGQDQ